MECFDDGYFEMEKLEKGWPSAITEQREDQAVAILKVSQG